MVQCQVIIIFFIKIVIVIVVRVGPRFETKNERGLSLIFNKFMFTKTENISEKRVIFY
jgi:hypothetical protein